MRSYEDRDLAPMQRRKILERDDYCCMYCFGLADQVDHIIPWSYLHDNSDDNLVASCWLCNIIAKDKVFPNFSRKRDYVINKRYWYQKRKIIPLWTKDEVQVLGHTLRTHIESNAVICRDDKELQRCKQILVTDGWQVVTKYTGKPKIGCALGDRYAVDG